MAYRRVALNYVTTAANGNEQQFTFSSPDTFQLQRIRKVYVGIATAGVAFAIYVTGDKKFTVDCTRFAAGNSDMLVDIDVPAQIPPVISLQNLAAGALTNVPVMIEYDVDQG